MAYHIATTLFEAVILFIGIGLAINDLILTPVAIWMVNEDLLQGEKVKPINIKPWVHGTIWAMLYLSINIL